MELHINKHRVIGKRNPMIYGHFIEHFHRQIYDGVYDPKHPTADEKGLRQDVLDAMRRIKVPVLRWPGGCFVSSYHWKDAVGKTRVPAFDKSWRVEDPNTFGTDEFIDLCRKIGCEPYICTNAGTGTMEEMSDWVEYCNLENEGKYAANRMENGYQHAHNVKYWSIGNENYGSWELGAKNSIEWGELVRESAKLIKRVDPQVELSAAANDDLEWNLRILRNASKYLDWISIHQYWDPCYSPTDKEATYGEAVIHSAHVEDLIRRTRGLLAALGLDRQIKIAFDEWNLRGWCHPNIHTGYGLTKEEYLTPRNHNDVNKTYTMADAVFSACFLNGCNRNSDIVQMANFAPIVNTRGCIFTHPDGLVLRTTYYIFDMFVNLLGETVIDTYHEDMPMLHLQDRHGRKENVAALDIVATERADGCTVLSAVNRDETESHSLTFSFPSEPKRYRIHTLQGPSPDAYNDVNHTQVVTEIGHWLWYDSKVPVALPPHSVNMIEFSDN